MIFQIDPASSKPVYQQIVDQVRYAIASGRLEDGDRLDAIRDVAIQTRVNRNTIARAYQELEREGLIRTRVGQGSFVCGDGAGMAKSRAKAILNEMIDDVLMRAHQFRVSEDELSELIRRRLARVQLSNKADQEERQ